mgnify:CR=1 FL=1
MNKISCISRLSCQSFGMMKTRAGFTKYHLFAAQNAASTASEIENKYKSATPSQNDLDLYLSQISTAIICSVAALESNINEYIIDHKEHIDTASVISEPKVLKKYGKTPKKHVPNNNELSKVLLQNTNLIFKYDIVWFIKKKDLLPENKHKHDIRYLTKLRNALTHFTPEWSNALSKHINLKKGRKNRFTLNPFYAPGSLFFPYHCLSASCAMWSCKVSNEFLMLFKSL